MAFVPGSVTLPKGASSRVVQWSSDTALTTSSSKWTITSVNEGLRGRPLDLSRWTLTPTGPGTSGMNEGVLGFDSTGFPSVLSLSDLLLQLNWVAGQTLLVCADVDGVPASFNVQLLP